ncbi:hypothetical protein ACFWXO_08375 [Kitasatospora sp. NPDC059088]|uniref:hypothetical protein n=1 Tax=Kitasatospora sp. NPDC059088 TaxID=3346722 RepID=UPI0036A80D6B
MDERSLPHLPGRPDPGGSRPGGGQAGVLGTALAGVLAAALASGSWQWFSTYLGLTLLAVVFAFADPPLRSTREHGTPGTPGTGFGRGRLRSLAAYSLVVGLCAALVLAPAMQRWAWLLPMPGTRAECARLGDYAALNARAALGALADQGADALASAQRTQGRVAVNDCLASTTTLWLPVYASAAALLTALAVHLAGRTRAARSGPGRTGDKER